MQINSFRYIIKVTETPTLSEAADALFISQPALSQHIRKIESEVGAELFIRKGHSLTLTSAGKMFIDCGRQILQAYDTMEREITASKSAAKESVRLGISPFYSKFYLPRLLPDFMKRFPNIQVDIDEDISVNLEKKLLDGSLDLCATPLKPKNDLLEYEVIRKEQIYIALPKEHPLNEHYPANSRSAASFPTIDLRLLKNESFICLKKIQKFTALEEKICNEAGIEPKTICETMNWDTVHMMIAAGLGVGFVPDILVGTITDPDICPCYYRLSHGLYRDYAIAQRRGAIQTESVKLFKKELHKTFGTIFPTQKTSSDDFFLTEQR